MCSTIAPIKTLFPSHIPSASISLAPEKNLVITVSADELIYLNDRVISLKQLNSQLQAAAKEDRPLLIKADRKASLGKVVQIWDMCREAGLSQINIATNQPAK